MWQKTKNLYHLIFAIASNVWFRFPSKKLIVIGVTGTDGKTTTTNLIYHILNSKGFNTSMVSSVGAIIGGVNYDVGFHVTTPSSFALQRFLKRAVESGKSTSPNFLVLETTSHALDQFRVFGIKFRVGVLTNVTHEHLDYHKTYENYVLTKAKLLKMSKISIVNKDDSSYKIISNTINKKLITYGIKNSADITPKNFPFKTNLIGDYNKYNILAAIAVCKSLSLDEKDIRSGIESFKPPIGRAEIIYDKDFTVMIDFAHTPNSFEQILKSIRPKVRGRIIHVFGSAGARDREKRPLMGKISSKYSDVIILTSEDPRNEPISDIMDDIVSGIINSKSRISDGRLIEIDDRKEAIWKAIKIAKKDDLVIMTGKSHEKSMNYGHGEIPWDEYDVTRKAIKNKKK